MAVKEKENDTTSNLDERSKALKLAIEKIEKDFGKGSIMKLGDKATVNVDAIPTGALSLDVALGIGGIPRGQSLYQSQSWNASYSRVQASSPETGGGLCVVSQSVV